MLANSPIPSLKPSRHYSIVEQLVLSCPELIFRVGNLAHFWEMNGLVSGGRWKNHWENQTEPSHLQNSVLCKSSEELLILSVILKFHTAIYKNYSTNHKFMKLPSWLEFRFRILMRDPVSANLIIRSVMLL